MIQRHPNWAGQGWIEKGVACLCSDHAHPTTHRDAVAAEPQRQGILAVGEGQRALGHRVRLDLAAQRVEGGEPLYPCGP